MATISYQLRPAYVAGWAGGVISIDDTRTYNVGAHLTSGSGTITEDAADYPLISKLDAYPPLYRTGSSPGAPAAPRYRDVFAQDHGPLYEQADDGSKTALSSGSGSAAVAVSADTSIPKSIASRCLVNAQAGSIVGTTTGETLEQNHKILANCDDITIAFSNSYGGGRFVAANTIYVRAAVRDNAGYWHRCTFNGGQSEVTLLPGVTLRCDPVGIGFSNGDRALTRTFVRVANVGELVPCGAVTQPSPYNEGVVSGDHTLDAAAVTSDGNYHYGPAGIFAEVTDAACVVGIYGDSISGGQNDSNANADRVGWVLRALADQWPYLQLSVPGDAAAGFKPPVTSGPVTTRKPRIVLAGGVTHALHPIGTNDLGGGTYAQLQDSELRVWRASKMRNQKTIAFTIMPSGVTSTDSFATLVNQTVSATSATIRVPYNNWLRAGAPVDPTTGAAVAIGTAGALLAGQVGHPLDVWIELADLAESSRDSGKWRVDLGVPSDGTHPAAVLCASIATNIIAALTAALGAKAPGAAAVAPVNDPTTIFGSKIHARYVASQITGKNDGDAISQWNDVSGHGRHLLQATGGKQPLYKTNINYSVPAVRFDGIDDFLQTAGFTALPQPYELLIVCKYRSDLGGRAFQAHMFGGAGGSVLRFSWGGGTAPAPLVFGAGSNLNSSFISDPWTGWHQYGVVFNGASSEMREDNTVIASGNAGAGTLSGLAVASDGNGTAVVCGDIDVQEVIVLNAASSPTERADYRAYNVSTYATP